ncbi:MAG: prephenate dehydratase [Thermodesulfobacteriota bacterium]|nr:prephenate dehydratase [Thermodesulfobacteriota bacterium]
MTRSIKEIREAIDCIDVDILNLLCSRANLSMEMGRQKAFSGRPPLDPAREKEILDRLVRTAEPPLAREMIEPVYNAIFSASRALQKGTKVAYLGPEGSYTHEAALSIFSAESGQSPMKDIDAVIQEVITARADLGIVPVENSTEGMIKETLDGMVSSSLHVIREILLPIRHQLISKTKMDHIVRIYSHPQAIAQCRQWIKENMYQAECIETKSTSDAAKNALKDDRSAAIASIHAARLYRLDIIAENINDSPDNITRFWVISKHMTHTDKNAKTSLIITLENAPGALFHAMGAFADQGINLTKIESRPSKKGTWEYIFFIDLQGDLGDAPVKKAMKKLKTFARKIVVLGSYPEERTPK